MADIFSPEYCDDVVRGAGTTNERFTWFYKAIMNLRAAVSTLDTEYTALTNRIGSDEADITANKAAITNLQASLKNLQGSFNSLSSDNISFKQQVEETVNELSTLVAQYNGTVNKLSASVVKNDGRITALESLIDPNLLAAISTKLDNIDADIKNQVDAGVSAGISKYRGEIDDKISGQNGTIDAATKTASDAVKTANSALQQSTQNAADIASLNTSIVKVGSDAQAAVSQEITDRTAADKNLAAAISSEASTRETADRNLGTQIDTTNKAVLDEQAARIAGDQQQSGLTAALRKEFTDYQTSNDKAVKTNADAITNEAATRAASDTALGTRIDALTGTVKELAQSTSDADTVQSQYLATVSRQIGDWAQGEGADYHIKYGSVDVLLGGGQKGQLDSLASQQRSLAVQVNQQLTEFGNRQNEFDGRLTQDEKAIDTAEDDIDTLQNDVVSLKVVDAKQTEAIQSTAAALTALQRVVSSAVQYAIVNAAGASSTNRIQLNQYLTWTGSNVVPLTGNATYKDGSKMATAGSAMANGAASIFMVNIPDASYMSVFYMTREGDNFTMFGNFQ